jgi:transposase InsO family protein
VKSIANSACRNLPKKLLDGYRSFNALAETIIGLFKAEVIHRLGPWKTADAVEWETLKWVDWFNNRRLLQPIGNIPPAEAEEKFYEQCNEFDKVA